MKYRKLTADGDYTFGQNTGDLYTGVEAVAQAVKTRLQLLKGTFWRDISDGLPLFQSILGTPGSDANRTAIDSILQGRIQDTPGVTGVVSFSSTFADRVYSYTATIQTQFSTTIIQGTI